MKFWVEKLKLKNDIGENLLVIKIMIHWGKVISWIPQSSLSTCGSHPKIWYLTIFSFPEFDGCIEREELSIWKIYVTQILSILSALLYSLSEYYQDYWECHVVFLTLLLSTRLLRSLCNWDRTPRTWMGIIF